MNEIVSFFEQFPVSSRLQVLRQGLNWLAIVEVWGGVAFFLDLFPFY